MKVSLGIVVIAFVLLFGGCTVNTTPQQGQPGAQGQAGQPGQAGQSGEAGQAGKPGQTGQQGQTGQPGQTGQAGQTGQQGQAAPCPAGQHRHTNSDTGKVSCVSEIGRASCRERV